MDILQYKMVSAFSFCIYNGFNPRYYPGLLENIELIQKHFPTWLIFVYVGNDVPDSFVIELRVRKNVILRFTHETGAVNMIHRFFAIDEPGVDMMFVRDADSRVHWKDRWAIREFLNTKGAKVHVIRDHPYHTAGIMGGLWGMRKIEGINIEALYREHKKATPKEQRLGIDQDFLMDVLYPRISQMILVHSSQEWKYHRNEILTPFPFTYSYDIFCGRVEDVRYDESEPPKNALENKPVTRSIFNILPRKMVKLS